MQAFNYQLLIYHFQFKLVAVCRIWYVSLGTTETVLTEFGSNYGFKYVSFSYRRYNSSVIEPVKRRSGIKHVSIVPSTD